MSGAAGCPLAGPEYSEREGTGGGGRAGLAAGNRRHEGVSAIESPVVVATFIASVGKELADRQQFIMDPVQMP